MTVVEGAVRVIRLNSRASKFLAPGKSWKIEPGVRLTHTAGDDRLMLEILDSTYEGLVHIDDEPVFDIAAIAPSEVFTIGENQYVFLEPFGVFIRPDVDNVDRRNALSFRPQVETDAVAKALTPAVANVHGMISARASQPSSAKPSKRWQKFVVRGMALAGAAAIGLVLMAVQQSPSIVQNTQQQVAVSPQPAVKLDAPPTAQQDAPGTATASPAATLEADPAVPATDLPEKASPAVPAVSKETRTKTQPPKTTKPAVKTQVKQATAKAQRRKPARWKQPKKKVAEKKPLVTPDQERQYRDMLESYRLEAGFDPEGSMQKMQELSRKVPHGTKVRGEIDRAIRELRNRL